MNRTQIVDAQVRLMLHRRTSWMLLHVWEMTEVIRDTHDAPPHLVESAAQFIDWTIDELDARYPDVLSRWNDLADGGEHCDLAAMYADAYARSLR